MPNAERAFIPAAKLRDYALCPDHSVGGHKARVFLAALGIAADNWEHLRDQIKARVITATVTGTEADAYGVHYEIPIVIDGLNGAALEITTAWILEGEDHAPRLTSAYVKSR